jgi:Lrp/AsnC family leucine-responsive transcriptional regulator
MLDNTDYYIIEKLIRNGRISLTDLAEGTHISRVAVANRIDKLLDSGILNVSALLNLDKLNYQTLIVELQVEAERKDDFKAFLKSCPKITQAFEVTGSKNFLLICSDCNNTKLKDLIENVLKKYSTEINVTLSSNPLNSKFVKLKTFSCKDCARCKNGD